MDFPIDSLGNKLSQLSPASTAQTNKCNLVIRLIHLNAHKRINNTTPVITKVPYLAISISYIDQNWQLQQFLLSLVKVTRENNISLDILNKNVITLAVLDWISQFIIKQIEKFSLFPFIHSIQFDLTNSFLNDKLRSYFQLQWKELVSNSFHNLPTGFNLSLQTPLLSPIPTNILIDMMAIDLLAMLSPKYLSMIRNLLSFVHFTTIENQSLFEKLFSSTFESLLSTSAGQFMKPELDNISLNYSLYSHYNSKEHEEKILFNLSDSSLNWECTYQMIKYFLQYFPIYEQFIHRRIQQIEEINSSSLYLPILKEFYDFFVNSSSNNNNQLPQSSWPEFKSIFQLIDWCFHVKKNILYNFKPLPGNSMNHCHFVTNHVIFHQFYDFNQVLKQTERNFLEFKQEFTKFLQFYRPYLNIYDLHSSAETNKNNSSEGEKKIEDERTTGPEKDNNTSSNNNLSQSIFESYSKDQQLFYITHVLDPRFRLNFLQEISEQKNDVNKNHNQQIDQQNKKDKKNLSESILQDLSVLFSQYLQLYHLTPLSDDLETQENPENSLQGMRMSMDNQEEENKERTSFSNNPMRDNNPSYVNAHDLSAEKSTKGTNSSNDNNNTTNYSFTNPMASNWLKKKTLALKYNVHQNNNHTSNTNNYPANVDQSRQSSSNNDRNHISNNNNNNHSNNEAFNSSASIPAAAVSPTHHHNSRSITEEGEATNSPNIAIDPAELYELNYYLKENTFFFHHLRHEKFYYANYSSPFFSSASSFSSSQSNEIIHMAERLPNNSNFPSNSGSKRLSHHSNNPSASSSPLLTSDFNVLSWWKEYSYQFPHLSLIAKHYLSIPAISTMNNFATGKDWLEDYQIFQKAHQATWNLQQPYHHHEEDLDELLSDEMTRDLLLGHQWFHMIQRNHWKPPYANNNNSSNNN
jgi:hypothetical protein